MGASTIVSAGSSIIGGNQAQAASQANAANMQTAAAFNAQNKLTAAAYNKQVSDQNAHIAEMEGEFAVQMADQEKKFLQDQLSIETQLLQRELARTIGKQTTAAAASGVMTNSGSTMDAVIDSVHSAHIDLALMEYENSLQEWRIDSDAKLTQWRQNLVALNHRTEGALAEWEATTGVELDLFQTSAAASAEIASGNAAAFAGYTGAGASLLSGGSKFYDAGVKKGYWK
jgi:hypothetical protein